jgi:hypothetical protein
LGGFGVGHQLRRPLHPVVSVPIDVESVVRVKCEEADTGVTITFEVTSHRLPKKLREDLFAPLTQAISTPFANLSIPPLTSG